MLAKQITYKTFDDREITETFYFHFNEKEIVDLETDPRGGFSVMAEKANAQEDPRQVMDFFSDLILKSYGEKSRDGKRFIKERDEVHTGSDGTTFVRTVRLAHEFAETNAFAALYMELLTNSQAGADFFNALFPKEVVERFLSSEHLKTERVELPEGDETPAWVKENRLPNAAEQKSMTREELLLAMRMKNGE